MSALVRYVIGDWERCWYVQMGPSGSGKTTLLDVLAGRKTQGTITGELAFSNHRPTKMFLRRYTGYVEQFDTLLGMLTVKEMLMYTAELKVSQPSHHLMACHIICA